ncbi:hypothetical protein PHPALM_28092 [Phytophthora palmivora]|uniref:Integrase catalytic domain-containing protein n=1 Tax=Phytophthora palmivora TaxID=4796 RepID=A0A2P4XAY4_9STRA|nr:hypothetical protein PHPALM_28092 [Phytophthora palmivora]
MKEIAATQTAHIKLLPDHCTRDGNDVYHFKGKLWIPETASSLLQRLFIISHCGQPEHRGEVVMLIHLKRMFFINIVTQHARRFLEPEEGLSHDLGDHCFVRAYETKPSTGIFFSLEKALLIPCDAPTTAVGAETMLWWHSRYRIPTAWVSDNATHLKSEVLVLLSKLMKAKQQFLVAYSPWLNGSVERVNCDVIQVLRAMILEYEIAYQDWVYIIPLNQANLNLTHVQSLAGRALIEVFTGLPCPSPVSTLFVPGSKPMRVSTTSNEDINESLATLRKSIAEIRRYVTDQREKRVLLNKKRAEVYQMGNFSVGEYILRSRVDEKSQNKLLVTWVGPFVVTNCNSHSFTVKHLITCAKNSDLEVTEELREHIAAQGIVLKVKAIQEHRWNNSMQGYELLVNWEGLEAIEDSWEPLWAMYRDVKVLVDTYVRKANDTLIDGVPSGQNLR